MDTCPPLEEIAAFLDGMLSPEDRERITTHLAFCESCYEVFAGVVHFQEGTLPPKDHPRWTNSSPIRPGAPYDEGFDGAVHLEYESSAAAAELVEARPVRRMTGADWEEVLRSPFADEPDRTDMPLSGIPAKEKVRPRASRWLPLAAALLLVPTLGYLAWREFAAPPRIVLADVAAPLELEASASDLYDGADYRGESSSARPSFMVGVYLLDLRQSLRAQDVGRSQDLLQDLSLSLQEIPLLPEDLAKSYEEEYLNMENSSDLARFAPRHPAQEAQIQEFLSGEDAFQFGLWTESGRLSASRNSPEFFKDRNNRRFLSHLFKQAPWVGDDLLEDVPGELQAIQQTWEAGDLDSEDYSALAGHFENIIEAYDSSDDL